MSYFPSTEALYRDHNLWLRGWLKRKLGCAETAADLTQDTFVRLLCASSSDDHKSELQEPRAYLTLIAKRLMLNLWRRRNLEAAYLEALAHLPEAITPSLEQQAVILETLQELDALLDSLPDKVRKAFLLSQLEGLGYAQIAKQLDVSERTVKRYMVQAMARCILVLS